MSADDRKRDNKVAVRLSDRELLDLSRNAALDERSLGDYIHFVLRRSLYGTVGLRSAESNGTHSAYESQSE